MDWGKIKLTLIVALIFTNIFLGYAIYSSNNRFTTSNTVSDTQIFDIVELMEQRNITLGPKSIDYYTKLPNVEAEYYSYDDEDLTEMMFDGKGEIHDSALVFGDETLYVSNKTELNYQKNVDFNKVVSTMDYESVDRIAREFVIAHELYEDDMELWDIRNTGPYIDITYKQYYKGLFLDNTYMKIRVFEDQVIDLQKVWFKEVNVLDGDIKALSPSEALFDLMVRISRDYGGEPVVIEKVELGYKLDSSVMISNLKSGELTPYWRVKIDDGNIYYVNAIK